MSDEQVVQLAEVAALRRHVEVGRFRDTQAAAVLEIVKTEREIDQ